MTYRRAGVSGPAAASNAWPEDGRLQAAAAGAGGVGRVADARPGTIPRSPSSGAVIFWLIVATLAVAALAIYFGSSGYPVFGLGLGFGFAVGAIPYGLLVLMHASAAEVAAPRTGRKRRMTDEEWQRIFGPRSSGPGAWTDEGPATGPGWSQTASGPSLDQRLAYELLGLEPGATMRQITRAYHRLAHRYHPDVTAGRPEAERALAERMMKDLNAAYDLLRHKHARAAVPA